MTPSKTTKKYWTFKFVDGCILKIPRSLADHVKAIDLNLTFLGPRKST